MRSTPPLDLTRKTLRATICRECPRRPPGSQTWESSQPRPCEPQCRLFVNLPMLYERGRLLDPMLASHRNVIGKLLEAIKRHDRRLPPSPPDGLTRQSQRVLDKLVNVFDGN